MPRNTDVSFFESHIGPNINQAKLRLLTHPGTDHALACVHAQNCAALSYEIADGYRELGLCDEAREEQCKAYEWSMVAQLHNARALRRPT